MTQQKSPLVISLVNAAGGTGKTTSAHALAVAFAEYGKKTLLIDLDARASLTFHIAHEGSRLSATDYLLGTPLREDALSATPERFDFIGADSRLASLSDQGSLSTLLENLPKEYDLVLLDHASSLDLFLAMALENTDLFLIPMFDRLHDLRGALQIAALLKEQKRFLLHIGQPSEVTGKADALIAPLDVSIEFSYDVEVAAATKLSVLTLRKESAVAESYRSAAYSILEILGLD